MRKTIAVVTVALFAFVLLSGCSKVDVDAMIEEAISAVSGGDLDGGMELFKKVLEVEPDHPRAHCGIGTIYREKGDYAKAIENYKKALELDPDYVICTHLLGFAYLKTEEYEKAEKFLLKACDLDPAYAESHFDLGQLYAKVGMPEEAVEELEKFISLSKDPARVEDAEQLIEQIKSEENNPNGQEG
ncbi:MAG: tetratricopeptide repeat protein [bacterium]